MTLSLVGELINTSRPAVKEAVNIKNESYIRKLAFSQTKAGATYIDVNCGNMIDKEIEIMEWLVKIIQDEVSTPLCIDSPNPKALEAGLELCKSTPMVNSISDEDERYNAFLPLIKKYNTKIVALCIDNAGMPVTADDRMKIVHNLYSKLKKDNIADEDIYFDPLVKPISSITTAGAEVLSTIRQIKDSYPNVHFMCGLSNISFGLPNRSLLNRLFVVQTMALGMDGYVLDPTNKEMMVDIIASKALIGNDPYCSDYLKAYRNGLFG